jgi:hypothetical protein
MRGVEKETVNQLPTAIVAIEGYFKFEETAGTRRGRRQVLTWEGTAGLNRLFSGTAWTPCRT